MKKIKLLFSILLAYGLFPSCSGGGFEGDRYTCEEQYQNAMADNRASAMAARVGCLSGYVNGDNPDVSSYADCLDQVNADQIAGAMFAGIDYTNCIGDRS